MKVIFYKAKYGNFADKLIGWYTRGPYSHCEVFFDTKGICFASSPNDGGTRFKAININTDHWDTIDIPYIDEDKAFKFCEIANNRKYDWLGLVLSQIFDMNYDEPYNYFCSELIVELLQDQNKLIDLSANRIHPNKLHSILNKLSPL
jgi:hypothetical protein